MTCDFMGAKQRAWILAGGAWFFDEGIAFPDLIALEGQVPVLALPKSIERDPPRLELAFGWAIADLTEQARGWVALVRIVRRRVAEVASAAATLLVCAAGAALVLR